MRHVIFATNSNQDYSFFAPICAQLWKSLGHQPHVFVVDESYTHGSSIALDELKKVSHTYLLKPIDGYRSSTLAQVSRLLGAALPVDDNDMLMTADVDMLPLNGQFFDQQGPGITIFYSNAYEEEPRPHFPICYISAPKRTWAQLTGQEVGHNELLAKILSGLKPNAGAGPEWGYDENWISERLVKHPEFPTAKLVPRERYGGMVVRRIDRARGFVNPGPESADDFHCWRPGYMGYWPHILHVIKYVCPDLGSWAVDYHARFVAALEKPAAPPAKPPQKATPFPTTRLAPTSLYRQIG